MLLNSSFYCGDDVVKIAKELLGKVIFTRIDGQLTSGYITETEAYAGIGDRASHAYANRRTKRTEIMYGEGGHSYVYLCYGMHYLFNVVTSGEGTPHAVLLRGIHPLKGIDVMEHRRSKIESNKGFTDGPGKVSQALGITMNINGKPLDGESIGIEDSGLKLAAENIIAGPRVGVDYAAEDALLPYRFRIVDIWNRTQKNLLTA